MNQQTTRPHTASDFLEKASETLGERGKQYDPNGKQERSMTAICAAFNAIYPASQLTVHMGWQFMSLVKMVRGATKPHADSALDQVAYAALAAEEVASQLHQPKHTAHPAEEPPKYYVALSQPELCDAQKEFIMEQVLAGHKVQIMSDATARRLHLDEELEEEPKRPTPYSTPAWAAEVARLNAVITTQDSRLHNVQLAHKDQVVELVAAQDKLRERELLDIETINDLRAELADKTALLQDVEIERNNWHNALERAESKVQELTDLAEYRDKRNAELCAELETQRGKCIAQSARLGELSKLVENLRSSLAQATKEAPCAHNTDEPKAPRPEYVDPYDSHGGQQPAPVHRLVGDRDPARGGLAYPQGKPL